VVVVAVELLLLAGLRAVSSGPASRTPSCRSPSAASSLPR
jgi:hypothetical protein